MKGTTGRRFEKPPLGSQIAANNLAIGLQIAAILNEAGGSGPNAGGGIPLKIFNLLGRNNGTGAGALGPGGQTNRNWTPTNQGLGFQDLSASLAGSINFGALSKFGTFNAISIAVMAGWLTGGGVFDTLVVSSTDGITPNFKIGNTPSDPNNWRFQLKTVSGSNDILMAAPSHSTNPNFMDLVIGTYDGTTMKAYLNGQLKNSFTVSSPISFNTGMTVELAGNSQFNSRQYTSPVTCFYLWNRAITPAEVSQLYQDPYWSLVAKPRKLYWGVPTPPPPPPAPSGGTNIPLVGNYGQSKAGFGINQKIITIPEMNTFDEVRQVLARVIGELQNHIATQLPIIDYKQRKITNVAPPTEGDDVVTLKYLQSVQLPAQPKSN